MHALKSRTIWFALALAVLAALEQSAGLVRAVVGEENFGAVMLAISVAVALLRVLTTQPLAGR